DVETEAIARAEVVVLQLEIPIETVVAAASRGRGTRILNAAPARVLPATLLSTVDVLVVNEEEAAALAPEAGGIDATLAALIRGVPRVAITLGPAGVRYAERSGERLAVAAPRVTPVDTTAAGDAFTGMLAVALGERRPMREALELACAAGSLCVESRGA